MIRFVIAIFALFGIAAAAAADDAAGIEHFEKSVRPLLIEHCASCHGEAKQSAGLRLDTVSGLRAGADDGPVLVAGKPGESRLIRAVRHEGDYAMPPNGKLPDAAIRELTAWVAAGTPMPKQDAPKQSDGKAHWAFQPVVLPPVPTAGAGQPIDQFIRAKLKEKSLPHAAEVDRRTLLRRLSFDLIGLPPTLEEYEAFERDQAPGAYERVVDRLLASPHYGERWARHWLDVARYADTKGYHFTEVRNFPFSYTYRDYVINAFNADTPFDRFIVEQIAADQLDLKNDNRPLAAMGMLTLGRRFENNIHDIIDDRMEVVFRGFMGISVGCARCHDHKYDPVSIRDYYSLYGVFASSREPAELPLLNHQNRTRETDEFEAELARKEAAAAAFYEKMTNEAMAHFRSANGIATYLIAEYDLRNAHANRDAQYVQERNLHTAMVQRWKALLAEAARQDEPIFRAWRALTSLDPAADFQAETQRVARAAATPPDIADALIDAAPRDIASLATLYGELIANSIHGEAASDWERSLVNVLRNTTHYEELSDGDEQFIRIAVKKEYRKLRNDAQTFKATSPKSPPRAMVLEDVPRPVEPVVFLRGNPHMRGPQVPRQFLEVIAGSDRKPFARGSGRLEMAEAIASPTNPLTARVIVNRVWAWHFGRGLVDSPSDFGTRTEPPSHPELLDWLAHTFVHDDRWSLKKLHRRIVLSETYRQSSLAEAAALAADPDNKWLARSPRRRLEFEPLRDAMLAAAGTLDRSRIGGRSEDIFKPPFSNRRSVYAFIERQNLPGTLRAFDFANPDHHVPQRYQTSVPQQALFLMNSPFMAEMARRVAARPEVADSASDAARVQAIFRAVLGRAATADEQSRALEFAASATGEVEPWVQLAHVLLMSNEFAFVD